MQNGCSTVELPERGSLGCRQQLMIDFVDYRLDGLNLNVRHIFNEDETGHHNADADRSDDVDKYR